MSAVRGPRTDPSPNLLTKIRFEPKSGLPPGLFERAPPGPLAVSSPGACPDSFPGVPVSSRTVPVSFRGRSRLPPGSFPPPSGVVPNSVRSRSRPPPALAPSPRGRPHPDRGSAPARCPSPFSGCRRSPAGLSPASSRAVAGLLPGAARFPGPSSGCSWSRSNVRVAAACSSPARAHHEARSVRRGHGGPHPAARAHHEPVCRARPSTGVCAALGPFGSCALEGEGFAGIKASRLGPFLSCFSNSLSVVRGWHGAPLFWRWAWVGAPDHSAARPGRSCPFSGGRSMDSTRTVESANRAGAAFLINISGRVGKGSSGV